MNNTIPEETKQCYLRVRTLFQGLVGAHPRITEICFGEGDDEMLAELREELDNLADHLGVPWATYPDGPWESKDEDDAQSMGWILACAEGVVPCIQKYDEHTEFKSDHEALLCVKALAAGGDVVAKKAFRIIREYYTT